MDIRVKGLLGPLASLSPNLNLRDSSPVNQGTVLRPIGELSPSGSVLLIALWSLCLLTVFAVYLGYGVRQKIVLVQRVNSSDSLYFIADAGVKQAIAELRKKDEDSEYYALNETWSNNPGIFKDIKVGLGEFSIRYNYIDYKSGLQEIRFGIIDEERKLDLNKAELDAIQRLITIVANLEKTEAKSLAASIVDWRDKDSFLSIPMGSAEDAYYRSLSIPYEAKDSELEAFDELLLIKGMSQEIFNKLKDYITIYSNGRMNINTATPQALLALNLDEKLVDKIISFRCGEDEIEATPDDNIFTSPSTIVEQLNQYSELSYSESTALGNLVSSGKISTDSSNFMVKAVAKLGRRESRIVCVVNREGKILSWSEG
jgi:type II secretory pathway component PulK